MIFWNISAPSAPQILSFVPKNHWESTKCPLGVDIRVHLKFCAIVQNTREIGGLAPFPPHFLHRKGFPLMFEYFFLIIWHVGKPKKPIEGTLKILPENLNPPPGSPLWIVLNFNLSSLQLCQVELAFSVLVEEASMGLILEERVDRWLSTDLKWKCICCFIKTLWHKSTSIAFIWNLFEVHLLFTQKMTSQSALTFWGWC